MERNVLLMGGEYHLKELTDEIYSGRQFIEVHTTQDIYPVKHIYEQFMETDKHIIYIYKHSEALTRYMPDLIKTIEAEYKKYTEK